MVRFWEHCPGDPPCAGGPQAPREGKPQVPVSSRSVSGLWLVQTLEEGHRVLLRLSPGPCQLKVTQAGWQRAGQGPDTQTGSAQKGEATLRTSVPVPSVPSTHGSFHTVYPQRYASQVV